MRKTKEEKKKTTAGVACVAGLPHLSELITHIRFDFVGALPTHLSSDAHLFFVARVSAERCLYATSDIQLE